MISQTFFSEIQCCWHSLGADAMMTAVPLKQLTPFHLRVKLIRMDENVQAWLAEILALSKSGSYLRVQVRIGALKRTSDKARPIEWMQLSCYILCSRIHGAVLLTFLIIMLKLGYIPPIFTLTHSCLYGAQSKLP